MLIEEILSYTIGRSCTLTSGEAVRVGILDFVGRKDWRVSDIMFNTDMILKVQINLDDYVTIYL